MQLKPHREYKRGMQAGSCLRPTSSRGLVKCSGEAHCGVRVQGAGGEDVGASRMAGIFSIAGSSHCRSSPGLP
jgi:hypothetical protein